MLCWRCGLQRLLNIGVAVRFGVDSSPHSWQTWEVCVGRVAEHISLPD